MRFFVWLIVRKLTLESPPLDTFMTFKFGPFGVSFVNEIASEPANEDGLELPLIWSSSVLLKEK